ncbi:hypothetical protein B0X71_05470 [Planococcus lenghuensis]|uniref:Uncharacterized protein n=1 Tax=Planococcus lenghuensis TaxID=2213202 RepID=A0A1Q2KWK7_9BACL|nr:hypothetical protein B0X71_05470 [Planococcus lenghuensis]
MYDIEGKVSKMSLASPFDGSHVTDFAPEETAVFLEQFLALEYVGLMRFILRLKVIREHFCGFIWKMAHHFRLYTGPQKTF